MKQNDNVKNTKGNGRVNSDVSEKHILKAGFWRLSHKTILSWEPSRQDYLFSVFLLEGESV